MSNVRFILSGSNRGRKIAETSARPILINGNGAYSGAPALVQDSAFPMSNALLPDRVSRIWYTGGPSPANSGQDLIVELDIAASPVSIAAVGFLGLSLTPGGSFPTTCDVEYLPGTVYNPTTGWLVAMSFSGISSGRDHIKTFPPISAKFWRFKFIIAGSASGLGFSLASFVVATSPTDLGFLYSRASETIVRPTTVVEGYGRTPVVTRTGLPFRRFVLAYDNNDLTTRQIFDNLGNEPGAFIYLAPDDKPYECIIDGEEFTRDHIWAPPDRFAWTFAMRSLP
jgi:hypothetical protein